MAGLEVERKKTIKKTGQDLLLGSNTPLARGRRDNVKPVLSLHSTRSTLEN